MTEILNLRVPSLHMLMFYITPISAMSKASRRRFFSAMRRALNAAGYVMSHCHGLCLVLPDGHQAPRTGRHDVTNWLLDQIETHKVTVYPPISIRELIAGKVLLVDKLGDPLDPTTDTKAATFLLRATAGALLRTVERLQHQQPNLRPPHGPR